MYFIFVLRFLNKLSMTTNLVDRISNLVQLGKALGSDEQFQNVCNSAYVNNPFFTQTFVKQSVDAICDQLLNGEKLKEFVELYPALKENRMEKTVGIIMAGNLPLVGFHDFMCVYLSGHKALVKLSSKDDKLFVALLNVLEKIDSSIREKVKLVDRLENFDAVIATGSNNSNRYFEFYFRDYPKILRANRSSVAVLSGEESEEELRGLADDVFSYFGLGCRSVSKLFVPNDYDLTRLFPNFSKYDYFHEHSKYMNNYDYYRSILLLNNTPHLADEKLMIEESDKNVSPISVVYAERYDDIVRLKKRIDDLSEHLQCVAMNEDMAGQLAQKHFIAFGNTQRPALTDYADGVDTVQFLLTL